MNTLTNEMTRLCGEIASLKESRSNLMTSIVSANADMQKDVCDMISGFRKARIEMADDTHKDLSDFTNKIKSSVTELRQKVVAFQTSLHNDLAGAHMAWHGADMSDNSAADPEVRKPHVVEDVEEPATESETTFEQAPKGKKKRR